MHCSNFFNILMYCTFSAKSDFLTSSSAAEPWCDTRHSYTGNILYKS